MLLLLEDNPHRISRFTAVWRAIAPNQQIHVWRNAHMMIRESLLLLPAASLTSLDHDLDPDPMNPSIDPGDGYLLAQWLASRLIQCPVIVHTSNADRGPMMMGALEAAGWPCHRVAAIGEDWIETHWRKVAQRILRTCRNNTD